MDQLPIGVGLKAQHYDNVLSERPALSFLEVHAENYMMPGGAHHRYLKDICQFYELSIHGVGMSLGSAGGLDTLHLKRFAKLVDEYNPALVSEHLAWSRTEDVYLNDLLPLPLNSETFLVIADNVAAMQDAIGRNILVENPSTYLRFENSTIPEQEFLVALADKTGCELLLDVNNVFVSCRNMGWDPLAYINSMPTQLIKEIHLAGHSVREVEGQEIRVDDHGSPVCENVWGLYQCILERARPVPTLIEWDNNIPDFATLMAEAERAKQMMKQSDACHD
ncbi:MAG: DUF692 domain-containing protein [Alphaproteobacteria bacterium]|nr:DUF692 domain-containing protein [Alphaproteobacteria bacterium]